MMCTYQTRISSRIFIWVNGMWPQDHGEGMKTFVYRQQYITVGYSYYRSYLVIITIILNHTAVVLL